jgi:hypothetical protein
MLSVESNKMLKKILSLVLNCEKKRDRKTRETPKGRSEESISSVDTRSTQTKIPDPWYN